MGGSTGLVAQQQRGLESTRAASVDKGQGEHCAGCSMNIEALEFDAADGLGRIMCGKCREQQQNKISNRPCRKSETQTRSSFEHTHLKKTTDLTQSLDALAQVQSSVRAWSQGRFVERISQIPD